MQVDLSRMTLPEILEHISDLPSGKKSEALKVIGKMKPDVEKILQLTFHKNLIFDLPKGDPPYKPLEVPDNWGYNRMPKELRKIGYFLKGVQNNLKGFQKEKMFIEMLESVSPEEAKLFLMMKNKKMTYKGITRKLVEESLPHLFVGEKEEQNV